MGWVEDFFLDVFKKRRCGSSDHEPHLMKLIGCVFGTIRRSRRCRQDHDKIRYLTLSLSTATTPRLRDTIRHVHTPDGMGGKVLKEK